MENVMTSLAKVEQGSAEVATVEGGLLEVIARAARDPSVDIDKMERLLEMQERVIARNAKLAFNTALAEMQPRLPVITERGRIIVREKSSNGKRDGDVIQDTPFARWEDINEAIRPLLHEYGFSLSFRTGMATDGKVMVTAVLSHKEGHSEETSISLPHDSSGSKNAVQAIGSSTSYGKRYTTLTLLNITSKGEDDDGASAVENTVIETVKDAPFPQGPAKNKTELKALGRKLWQDIEAAEDSDAMEELISANSALLGQLERGMPSWVNGGRDGQGETYEGLRSVIERRRSDFSNIQ
jgi:hypothetical protein